MHADSKEDLLQEIKNKEEEKAVKNIINKQQ